MAPNAVDYDHPWKTIKEYSFVPLVLFYPHIRKIIIGGGFVELLNLRIYLCVWDTEVG